MKQGKETLHIRQGVKRYHRRFTGTHGLSGLVFRFGFLDMGAVLEHDIAQTTGLCGGIHRPAEALLIQQGKHAGVIDMRVGKQHKLDFSRRHGERGGGKIVFPLLHTIVNQDVPAVDFQQGAAARYIMVGPKKRHSHENGPLFYAVNTIYIIILCYPCMNVK